MSSSHPFRIGLPSSGLPSITTERLILRLGQPKDVPQIVRYYLENRAHLTPFEPDRSEMFFTAAHWQLQVEQNLKEYRQGQSLRLFIAKQSDSPRIIGSINFNQMVYGVAHYALLGYSLAGDEQGRGYMTEALTGAIAHVFDVLNLHRVMANYVPRNQRSGRLLRRLGFTIEGYARDYLLINGRWEDHILTSRLNPNWRSPS